MKNIRLKKFRDCGYCSAFGSLCKGDPLRLVTEPLEKIQNDSKISALPKVKNLELSKKTR